MAAAVLVDVDGPILTITLNRPEVRNAINLDVCAGMAAAIDRLEADPEIRVGVLTGAGSVFCSGADLRAAAAGESLAINDFKAGGFAGFVRRERRKPVIAAAQGAALAGGLEILLACDISVVADTAMFGLPEVRIGIMAAAGGVIALARDRPLSQVLRLLLTGKPIDATEALRLGLVSELAPRNAVLDQAYAIARDITAAAPLAVQATLALARSARSGARADDLQRLNDALIEALLAGPDAIEGRAAFLEKRDPVWSGA